MLSTGNGKLRYPQLLDRYLSDPNLVDSNYANVTEATEDKYTVRLGQVLNAYFACLNGFFAITAGINNETAYSWDNNRMRSKFSCHTVVPRNICPCGKFKAPAFLIGAGIQF
jgi:hypothetical protein